tara:strand:- start:381 stop:512 length:132 start_codon:yes stop_codon:yes gene_type:complete
MSEQGVLFGVPEPRLCTKEENLVWIEFLRLELRRRREEVNEYE